MTIELAIGHDNEHRLDFAISQQVVGDEISLPDGSPCRIVIGITMQQVKHGQVIDSLIVTRGSIDKEAAMGVENLGEVKNLSNIAVGYISQFPGHGWVTRDCDE